MKTICIILFILFSILMLVLPAWSQHKKTGTGPTPPHYGINDEMKV